MKLYLAFIGVLNSFLTLSVYCIFGSDVTEDFSKYSDYVYDAKWYEWSHELQKALPVILANAQVPMEFDGFGMFTVNSNIFTQVRDFLIIQSEINAIYLLTYMLFNFLFSDFDNGFSLLFGI